MKFFILVSLSLLTAVQIHTQSVGINNSGGLPDPNAILDIEAADKGVLFPRTTPSNIVSPVDGLIIYDTTEHVFKYYDGLEWQSVLNMSTNQFWFADQDGDGYGFPFNVIYSPIAPENYVANNDDCDDTDSATNPEGNEICDDIDNDCDTLIDDADPDITGQLTFYIDSDGDGYGNMSVDTLTCDQPVGYVSNSDDCNDSNPGINPDATEECDGIDNDCDGLIDDEDPSVNGILVYPDMDGDQFGDGSATPDTVCIIPPDYADNNFDCDDSNPNINPLAPELCDGIDNDCDPTTEGNDEPLLGTPCDGPDTDLCEEGVYVCNAGSLECDDMTGDNIEICDDGIDNDCDGQIDCPPGFTCCNNECVDTQENINHCGNCNTPCDDGFSCTIDFCEFGNCEIQIEIGHCFINNTCYMDGDPNPVNECQFCDADNNQTDWTPVANGQPCAGGNCLDGICTP
jgi:hypothetical protein